jgi:alkaline phosphatase D
MSANRARASTLDYPFTLGVASGDPEPDGMVLWTRLAPDPLGDGSMPREAVMVDWEVALDEGMSRVVRRGRAIAEPRLGHSVHVTVTGLDSNRWYWYRFIAADASSPVGRTRTASADDERLDRLRFAFASCQHYEAGFYAAHRHLAAEDLDLVVFLGDYIYESSLSKRPVREHGTPEPRSLEDYRRRYALYKLDSDLQAAHAAFPWVLTWDDHEVDNDYADDRSHDREPPERFLGRRAAAYQAYYEHQPLRIGALPRGPHMPVYRRIRFGDLAEFNVLDNRQYRSDQPCNDGWGGGRVVVDCDERWDPARTMLGDAQERWLLDGLAGSRVRWNVIAQQLLMAEWDSLPGPGERTWSDGWSGYAASRDRILSFMGEHGTTNPVVISGDIHTFWVADLHADARDPRSPVVASELVGTSISSRPSTSHRRWHKQLSDSPHLKYLEGSYRGYARVELDRSRWHTDLRVIDDVRRRDANVSTLASFVIEDGLPGARLA